MATDQISDVTTPVTPEPNPLETTTPKDSALAVNAEPAPAQPTTPGVAAPVPEVPITITPNEVTPTPAEVTNPASSVTTESSDPNDLSDQVESLSGEIQALEAKIDRLTGNIKPVAESPAVSEAPAVNQPAEPLVNAKEATLKPAENKPVTPEGDAYTLRPETKTTAVNDIYSKPTNPPTPPPPSLPTPGDTAEDVSSSSTIGTIGEALSVIGVIIFLIMVASPFFKSLLPTNISDLIKTIGWPTTTITLFIGFIISLFGKGKVLTKIFTFILLILAILFYLSIAGYQNWLGPVGPILDSLTSFYK